MPAHILIIEDNEMSLVLAEYLLRQAGYATSTAVDGGSGVRLAMENTADLILCDLDLPTMDGAQVVGALRADGQWRAVPVLAFTAASMNEEQRNTLASDFDGCIAKPIDPGSFTTAIAPYLAPELRAARG
jgi:CheY-like chemotaxis protein